MPSAINIFVKKRKVDYQPSSEDNWNKIIDAIRKDSVPGVYTDYSGNLNSAISFAQNNTLKEEQVNELADALFKFCEKLADQIADGSSRRGFFDITAKNNINSASFLMGEAILSAHLADSEAAYTSDKVKALQNLFMAADVPCSLLNYCTNNKDREDSFLESLFCGKKDYAADAAGSLYALNRYEISIGEKTKESLLTSVLVTMDYEITPYLRAVEFIARKGLLTTDQISQLDKALPKYLNITAIDENDTEDAVSEKLVSRKWASMLAHSLYRIETKREMPVTPGVALWEETNKEPEEFAEIRNSWDEWKE